MEDAGAGAVVLHSLFEEQLNIESHDLDNFLDFGTEAYAESLTFFPDMSHYNTGPEGYLAHVGKSKAALEIPVIASLNGSSLGGWIRYAKKIEQAGADALELNLYDIPTDPKVSAAQVESRYLEIVREVRANIMIPIAVKLGPFFSAPAEFASRLDALRTAGIVLFNRFYQPDFDPETLEIEHTLHLSTPEELLLRLHWIAIIYGHIKADLAVTGGVHSARDILKSIMAGAKVAMMTSALLKHGIDYLSHVLTDLRFWMNDNGYLSTNQMRGSMCLRSVTNPSAFERANYMKVLRNYALRAMA
jgi:dihydroorotate dehydrogenase (fumarate)